jgi:trigger factor
MHVTVESTSSLGRKMTVEVPAENVDSEVEKRLKSLSREVRIHGFRPGKVPYRVVKQRFGNQVQQEVMKELLRSSYQEAVIQEKLHPVGGPNIEPVTPMGQGVGLKYIATFEVYPDFDLAPAEGLKIKRPAAQVTEQDIDNMLNTLRERRKRWEKVERAARFGDQVVIDFEGEIEGQAFDDNTGENVAVELGRGQMLTEFEEQLIGVTEGDTKTLNVRYPENYSQSALQGKKAEFNITVKTVSASVLPDVNSEFARAYGVESGEIEQLRQNVRENMERELRQKIKAKIKKQVMDGLLTRHAMELPEVLVSEEISHLREQAMQALRQTDTSKFPDSLFEEEARRRVSLGLIIGEIVTHQEIHLDNAKVQQHLENIAASYESPQQVISNLRGNNEAMAQIETIVLEEQVVEWVMNHAEVTEENVSFEQVVNPESVENQS